MWAARGGHCDVMKLLLEQGFDLSRRDEDSNTVADHAREYLEVRSALRQVADASGALLGAAQRGDVRAARQALQEGAYVNVQDELGWTPLTWSAMHHSLGLVQLLAQHLADPSAVEASAEVIQDAGLGKQDGLRVRLAVGVARALLDAAPVQCRSCGAVRGRALGARAEGQAARPPSARPAPPAASTAPGARARAGALAARVAGGPRPMPGVARLLRGAALGVAAAQPLAWPPAPQGPLVVGGVEFSREDDLENVEKLSNLFGSVFYTKVLSPGDSSVDEAWQGLSSDIWALAEHAAQAPSLALAVSMTLYSYFWWEGPHSGQLDLRSGRLAAELMYASLGHSGCRDRGLSLLEFFVRQCHMRWRYLMMLLGEVGRHLVLQRRDLAAGAEVLGQARACFREMAGLPQFGSGPAPMQLPHQANFNEDYFPAAVARQGPVWRSGAQDVPMAAFLEENFPTIRAELDSILAVEGAFDGLDAQTRNAETQFGPRGDDWLTAYMVRNTEFFEPVCALAPRTCALLRSRPEVAGCRMGGSGAGFLRMRPGGRLKPHFGNAPRLSVHLGLIVPEGEIFMSVGNEVVRWEEGRALVFDDTFIHSVTHNEAKPRYVLNVWMCHPCDAENGRIRARAKCKIRQRRHQRPPIDPGRFFPPAPAPAAPAAAAAAAAAPHPLTSADPICPDRPPRGCALDLPSPGPLPTAPRGPRIRPRRPRGRGTPPPAAQKTASRRRAGPLFTAARPGGRRGRGAGPLGRPGSSPAFREAVEALTADAGSCSEGRRASAKPRRLLRAPSPSRRRHADVLTLCVRRRPQGRPAHRDVL
ncbi:unnamed protein product [Prorocentrum cordatum]|uniref:Aspartyl/asparaginy/proline hydroxylase domain-containing protein n=1 Tax=Prorocentrum cordatum TaxID=2364126 RepID=A0ABN9QL11_9DINO|nr:unnamed protein product [Polarella glacialis]